MQTGLTAIMQDYRHYVILPYLCTNCKSNSPWVSKHNMLVVKATDIKRVRYHSTVALLFYMPDNATCSAGGRHACLEATHPAAECTDLHVKGMTCDDILL